MTNDSNTDETSMSREEIQAEVSKRIAQYESLAFFEQFAMFMGKAQILELGLKGLLARDFAIADKTMERWTLGKVRVELVARDLRSDFCTLLKSLVDHRNYIAHELLANQALFSSLSNGDPGRFEVGRLHKGIYEVEQLILFYDWCEEHKARR
jgi:hypothetical protein